jgi:acetyl esterase
MDDELVQLAAAGRARGLAPLPAISAAEARARIAAGNRLCAAGPEIDSVEDLRIPAGDDSIELRVYRHGTAPLGTLVYFHGGGWVTGDLEYADELLRFLASDTGLTVVSVDYRLAPEHPFPIPLEDARAALTWTSRHLAEDGMLIVGGDSAGGNLAAACVHRAQDEHRPRIDLQVLIYPVVDSDFTRPSYDACATSFPLGRADLEYCFSQYVPDVTQRDLPLVAPLRAPELDGLPPALVVVAGHDPLHDEGVAYATRMAEAGPGARLLEFPALCHGFLRFTGASGACATARDVVTTALRDLVEETVAAPRQGATDMDES